MAFESLESAYSLLVSGVEETLSHHKLQACPSLILEKGSSPVLETNEMKYRTVP